MSVRIEIVRHSAPLHGREWSWRMYAHGKQIAVSYHRYTRKIGAQRGVLALLRVTGWADPQISPGINGGWLADEGELIMPLHEVDEREGDERFTVGAPDWTYDDWKSSTDYTPCLSRRPGGEWCTRTSKHAGQHVAGTGEKIVAVWS